MSNDTFYFIAHPRGDKSKVTVIDLSHKVGYERYDWDAINDVDFTCHKEAITYAKVVADKYNLQYEMFYSRYDNSLNETLELNKSIDEYPMQPIVRKREIIRFESNPIIEWLCTKSDFCEIYAFAQNNNIDKKYLAQLEQLAGCSTSRYCGLDSVSEESLERVYDAEDALKNGGRDHEKHSF